MSGFVGVHTGAGAFSDESGVAYRKLCRNACRKAIEVLNSGGNAVDAVTVCTTVLEDSPLTNAGFGSNLTWTGAVECDASLMDGRTLSWGGVGAVPGVRNPITVARSLCTKQSASLALGRVPPCLLVGEGARLWAEEVGIPTTDPKSLVSDRARKIFNRCKRKLSKAQKKTVNMLSPLDTVGAVCIDSEGHVAAASSSGGIILKHSGRAGQAAMYGCGCWAQDGKHNQHSVATTTSGCGEYLMRTMLAKEAASDLMSADCGSTCLHGTMVNKFLESPYLVGVPERLAGVISLKSEEGGIGEFLWAHTTRNFCIGYMSSEDSSPQSQLSKLPRGVTPGSKAVVGGVGFTLKRKDNDDLRSPSSPP